MSPAEVEAALAAQPDVLEAYVTGVRDPGGTAGTQVVAAAVVPAPGAEIDVDELRVRLKEDLSAFKIPKVVWVGPKAGLPFTDSGKIKRADLAALLAAHLMT